MYSFPPFTYVLLNYQTHIKHTENDCGENVHTCCKFLYSHCVVLADVHHCGLFATETVELKCNIIGGHLSTFSWSIMQH